MFMKKRITFIATLLILACVALAGSSAWAAPTMKPEDVIVYDKSDPNQAPYTMLRVDKNMTVYYEGTGYSSVLGAVDISVVVFKDNQDGTPESDTTYKVVNHVLKAATTPPNVCKLSSDGTIKGSFLITKTDLTYDETKIGDKVEIYIKGLKDTEGNEIPQTFFIKQTNAPLRLDTFMPRPSSEIRTFFTTSIKVESPPLALDDENYNDVYSWLMLRKSNVTGDENLKVVEHSPEFSNPAYLVLDPAAEQLAPAGLGEPTTFQYDLVLLTRDLAANTVPLKVGATADADKDSKTVRFKYFASTDSQNARTRVDIDPIGKTLQLQVLIPPNSMTARPSVGDYEYYIVGDTEIVRVPASAAFPWDPNSGKSVDPYKWVKKCDIFNIGPKITIDDTDPVFIEKASTWSKARVTLGMPVDGRFTYFGAADQVGPILLKAQVDTTAKKTILTFSEPLEKSAANLDKNDFEVGGTSFRSLYPSATISYDSAADNKIILGVVVDSSYLFGIIKNNHVKDINGNKAEAFTVPVRIGRTISSVEVTDVGNKTTTIKVIFNEPMKDEGAGIGYRNKDYYRVTVVPGLENLASKKTHLIKPDSVVASADKDYVTLTIKGSSDTDGMLKDTSASGLPQVIITDIGMENIKGTNNETLISNNKGVASIDRVGPYIVSAKYNHHATDKQPVPDKTTYHVLTLTFSEPVECKYLSSPRAVVKITSDVLTQLGRDAAFVQQTGLASTVDIQMGQDKTTYGNDLTGLGNSAQVQLTESYADLVRDADGNGACMYYDLLDTTQATYQYVSIKNITVPWIIKVTTKDMYIPELISGVWKGNMTGGYNGIMDTLEVTWNDTLTKRFTNKDLVTANTKVKDGYYLNPNMSTWSERNPIYFSGKAMQIPVKEKKQGYDTGATPGFSLYLDSANYFMGTTTGEDYLFYKVDKSIDILSSNVSDGIPPYPVKVTWHKEMSPSNTYTVRVMYSEVIDPNVYQSTGDPYHRAHDDFAAYYVTAGKISNSTALDDAVVKVGDYITSSCIRETLAFTVTTQANFDLTTVTFAPRTDVGKNSTAGHIDDINDPGVFDMAGNMARSGATLKTDSFPVEEAVEYLPPSSTDPVANHAPKRSAYYMMLYGTVTGSNGDPVSEGATNLNNSDNQWSIYAYSLDNLYRFKHLSRYPAGKDISIPANVPDHEVYLSKAEHDPNCVKECAVTAILAPDTTTTVGGVCYGSASIQPDGRYTMYVYSEFFETPGFKEGDPIFLVVQAPNKVDTVGNKTYAGKKYLVTNNCKADNFYLTFTLQVNQGIKQYDIDLGNYESKKLSNGWNFVSFSTLKRYVLNNASSSGSALRDENNDPISESICPVVPVANIGNALTSLTGQWSKIYFVDGAKDATSAIRITSRDPKTGVESGLDKVEYFSIGNGYWIYLPTVKNGAELVVLGKKVVDNDPLYHMELKMNNSGVNMVGYWGGKVYDVVDPLYTVDFSSLVLDVFQIIQPTVKPSCMQTVDSIDDVLAGFSSGLSLVRCSYEKGPQSWYSPVVYGSFISDLSDLIYVGPGYGYYMVINKDCNITWPVVLK